MTEEAKPATETEEPKEKKPSFLSKIAANKAYILHSLLVFILFSFFAWQILDFYQLSTNYNRARAVKTNHMVVYDIETGKYLTNLPSKAQDEEVEDTKNPANETSHTDAIEPEEQTEVAVIVSGLGKDAAYTNEVTSLPPEFVFAYSPYGPKPLETSKYKASEGATVLAEAQYADGKFDISAKNDDFRNFKNVEAAMSKIFGANILYLNAPASFFASPSFGEIASKLEEKQILVVVPQEYTGSHTNIVSANVIVKAVTAPEEIKAALAKLEEAAKSHGYAIAVIEPQPGVAALLKEWANGLEAKKIKLTPVIKN